MCCGVTSPHVLQIFTSSTFKSHHLWWYRAVPGCSPTVCSIENMWCIMKRKIPQWKVVPVEQLKSYMKQKNDTFKTSTINVLSSQTLPECCLKKSWCNTEVNMILSQLFLQCVAGSRLSSVFLQNKEGWKLLIWNNYWREKSDFFSMLWSFWVFLTIMSKMILGFRIQSDTWFVPF